MNENIASQGTVKLRVVLHSCLIMCMEIQWLFRNRLAAEGDPSVASTPSLMS